MGTTGRAGERTGGGPVKRAAQKPGSTSLAPVVPPQLTGSSAGKVQVPVEDLGPRPVHPDGVVLARGEGQGVREALFTAPRVWPPRWRPGETVGTPGLHHRGRGPRYPGARARRSLNLAVLERACLARPCCCATGRSGRPGRSRGSPAGDRSAAARSGCLFFRTDLGACPRRLVRLSLRGRPAVHGPGCRPARPHTARGSIRRCRRAAGRRRRWCTARARRPLLRASGPAAARP